MSESASYEVEFDLTGTIRRDTGLVDAAQQGQLDDVFVFSHGWNSGADSARRLYGRMFGLIGDVLGRRAPDKQARMATVGLFWPSLLFPHDDPGAPAAAQPSGAELANALKPAFPDQPETIDKIGHLLQEQGGADQLVEFHGLAAQLVTTPNLDPSGADAGESATRDLPAGTVVNYYSGWPGTDGGAAQGLLDPIQGLWNGAREVLRTLSYYEMKNRAGVVGRRGLGPLLSSLVAGDGTRPHLHLMGHSFGARLVSYALSGLDDGLTGEASPVKSLVLIQGAFSHFTFRTRLPFNAGSNGALADCLDRVDGPMLATFSGHDRAVGWWYPLASMLKREDASSQQDLLMRWGAMGGDGYQNENAVDAVLAAEGAGYPFATGGLYRLDANAVIREIQSAFSGAHSDICHPEVAWAAVAAAGLAT